MASVDGNGNGGGHSGRLLTWSGWPSLRRGVPSSAVPPAGLPCPSPASSPTASRAALYLMSAGGGESGAQRCARSVMGSSEENNREMATNGCRPS